MSVLYGKGYLTNPASYTLTPNGIAGYVSPVIPAPEIVDQEDEFKMLKDQLGLVEGVICPDDCILRCTFNFIPRGNTVADATKAACLPTIGGYGISGFPIIQIRKFTDGWNTNAGNTQPWFYFGGGTLTGGEDGKNWTGTIALYRFYYITSATPKT